MARSHLTPVSILEGWRAGSDPIDLEFEQLAIWELTNDWRSRAFGINSENAATIVRTKADLFFSIIDILHNFYVKSTTFLETLWNLWLPLAMQISAQKQSLKRPLIQGILGGQGTGKTTLAEVLRLILGQLGYSTVSLSLDDLYKTYTDRQKLQKADPRLIWRGPPGTHDLELGIAIERVFGRCAVSNFNRGRSAVCSRYEC